MGGQGALVVKDQQELLQTVQRCLLEPEFAGRIAQNGREVIRKNQGATAKTVEQIGRLLKTP
ncbi:MAG: hypothetical protein A2Z25_22015 [Planctomycetes bacterium RBG_16_55_9]|nr:MAG: hypothetical protein A2Z25_22015 [Planctomycetes bacterium RBG_16_55_9]